MAVDCDRCHYQSPAAMVTEICWTLRRHRSETRDLVDICTSHARILPSVGSFLTTEGEYTIHLPPYMVAY